MGKDRSRQIRVANWGKRVMNFRLCAGVHDMKIPEKHVPPGRHALKFSSNDSLTSMLLK